MLFWVNFIIFSCGENKIENVEELSLQLKSRGLDIVSEDSLDITSLTHARIEEAVLVQGENLKIEIYRIEDQRTFKLFIGSGILISGIEEELGEVSEIPEKMWFKQPFIVIIREEPQPGLVAEALDEVFN
ncbi:MAG: hypothetical protein APR63_14095 [Desulfuromonas sp. SDB]|nr:MAG: hypothetical protein APR63_14095 [Desulfuromonas sp. SDB]